MDLEARLRAAAELVSEHTLQELVELIWSTDHRPTFPNFQATARHVSNKLREWDIRARVFELPADGRTVLGDWKVPLGWDCVAAQLEIHDPAEERGRSLCDYRKQPAQVIRWSGPTPPQGVLAEVVRIAEAAEVESRREQLQNKIVYTPLNPRPFKKALADAGALAVLTSYSPHAHHLAREYAWVDAWSDDPAGWAFHDGDAPLPGLVISPECGVELDILLDRGRVKLKLKIESKYYETTLPVACGYMDGELQEEVLGVGRAFSPGANDASGAAVVLESLRVIRQATGSDGWPAPRRAVRGLLVPGEFGLTAFCLQNPGIVRRIHGAASWDYVGRFHENVGAAFRFHRCPDAGASVTDTLMALLLEAWLPQNLPYLRLEAELPFMPAHNGCCDPAFGVPCPAVLGRDRFQGTSGDTPKDLSPAALHAFATISVAYLYLLAAASAKDAFWLAHQTVRRYGRRLEDLAGHYALKLDGTSPDKPVLLARAVDHLTYLREVCEAAAMSAKRFMLHEERAPGHFVLLKLLRHTRRLLDIQKRRLKELAGCDEAPLPAPEGLGDLAELRPWRKFAGTPTYASAPSSAARPASPPTCHAPLHAALFWADGNRTLADILRRVGYEYADARSEDLVAHFRFMGDHGLVQWLEPGEPVPKPAKPEEEVQGSGMEAPQEEA